MDINVSPEVLQIKETIRAFIAEVVEPMASEIETHDRIPSDVMTQSRELGLFGLSIPECYGGLGLSMVDKCAVFEELGRTSNGYTTVIGAHNGIGSVGLELRM